MVVRERQHRRAIHVRDGHADRQQILGALGIERGEAEGVAAGLVVTRRPLEQAARAVEEGAGRQHIGLALGGRQALVVGQVLAVHHELGGGAAAVGILHHHYVAQALAVAAVHLVHEGGEGGLALLALTLVDIVHHVLDQQVEEGGHVAGIEGGVVGLHQFGGGHG